MATELKTQGDTYKMTRFYGGEDGVCVQVNSNNIFDHVRLTREQARSLAADLMNFAAGQEEEDY